VHPGCNNFLNHMAQAHRLPDPGPTYKQHEGLQDQPGSLTDKGDDHKGAGTNAGYDGCWYM
jgi:hypothetical protein